MFSKVSKLHCCKYNHWIGLIVTSNLTPLTHGLVYPKHGFEYKTEDRRAYRNGNDTRVAPLDSFQSSHYDGTRLEWLSSILLTPLHLFHLNYYLRSPRLRPSKNALKPPPSSLPPIHQSPGNSIRSRTPGFMYFQFFGAQKQLMLNTPIMNVFLRWFVSWHVVRNCGKKYAACNCRIYGQKFWGCEICQNSASSLRGSVDA